MQFKLTGSINAKIGHHSGLYSKSYQEARALYDAQIRSWEIEFKDNLFLVKNSDNIVESCYFEHGIKNCSCLSFVEMECGTCMHLEAVQLASYKMFDFPSIKIRPITFVNKHHKIQTIHYGNLGSNIFETPAVASVRKFSRDLPYNLTDYGDVDVLKSFGINLYSFQKESIKAMLKNMRSVLILKMGLGKTICGLVCCKLLNKDKVLIVAPNSLKYQWAHEINRFNLGSSIVISKRGDIINAKNKKFVIVSYEMLNFNPQILDEKYDILIADEIQKIKNQESETWKTISKVKTEYVFALSGTPIQNSINDLISLVNFLNPAEFKPEWKFYTEFCHSTKSRILGIIPEKIIDFKDKVDRYLINPKIDYSAFSLPGKKENIITTNLNAGQMNIHDNYFDMAKILIAKSMNYPLSFQERIMLNAYLTKARMAATDGRLIDPSVKKSDKFYQVELLIKQLTSDNKKVVVYSEWIKTLELLRPFLDAENISYVFFTGEINAKKRDKALMSFIQNSDIKVFLSTDSGGQGIDGLQTASSNVIHLEKIWNPMKIEQRNGRLIRPFQKEAEVNVHYFYTTAGIETMIGTNNNRKHSLIFDILG